MKYADFQLNEYMSKNPKDDKTAFFTVTTIHIIQIRQNIKVN